VKIIYKDRDFLIEIGKVGKLGSWKVGRLEGWKVGRLKIVDCRSNVGYNYINRK
jgi:hypothetical protein